MISGVRLKAAIAVACASASFASPLSSQTTAPDASPPAPPQDGVTDDFGLGSDGRARMTVPISIQGKGPYNFLVDTGAERTVISTELANRLELAAGQRARMHSMSGVGPVDTVVIPQLQVSKKSISGIIAPSLKAVNIGAYGILGTDTLQSQRVTFDFGRQKMTVVPSRVSEPSGRSDEIVVRARSRFGRLVLVDATLEGQKLVVVLDTGSEVTIGNSALRRKLEEKSRLLTTVPLEVVSVTGDKIGADYTKVKQIRLGGVLIRDLPVAFADVHPFRQLELTDRPALLLGMDALRLFDRVSVDFADRKVRFLSPDLSGFGSPVRTASLSRSGR